MTDLSGEEPSAPTPVAAAKKTAGDLIREARQQQGMSLEALALMIKVPQRKLECLEEARWAELKDVTFARALAQTVCRALKADPAPVLRLMPGSVAGNPLELSAGINAPFRDRLSTKASPGALALMARPVVWGPLLIVGLALLVLFAPSAWFSLGGHTKTPAPQLEQPQGLASAPAERGGPEEASAPAWVEAPLASPDSPAGASSVAATVSAASAVASGPARAASPSLVQASAPGLAKTPTVAPTLVSPASMQAASGQASASVFIPVEVQARQEAWVQIKDAQGQVLLSRTVIPGERVALQGRPPLQVVVGNASVVTLSARGQLQNLTPHIRDNVARLELR